MQAGEGQALANESRPVFVARKAAATLAGGQSSNAGRLDMALRFNGQVYLFEFKVVELAPKGRALQQSKDAGYADRYLDDRLPIHLIGLEFSREQRTLEGFEVETLQD
jgi:hypothetical protein